MKKTVSIILLVVILSLLPLNTAPSSADTSIQPPAVDAESCILIDAVTGNVIYEKNADKKEYPASTTKIMTAGLAIEMGYYDKKTVVSQEALDRIGYNGSNVALKAGEVLNYSDLLNMALISSANDAADVIAEGVAGDIDEFVGLMNNKAKQLGLTNTHFSNPVGLDSGDGYPTHQTTAHDLAMIMRYSSSEYLFRQIIGKSKYPLPTTNIHPTSRGYKTSTDALLTDPSFRTDDYTVIGGKTGYTQAAQNVFTACARNSDGYELILVLMKEPDRNGMFQDAEDMFGYGFRLVESNKSLAQKGFYDVRYRSSDDVIESFYQKGYILDDGDGRFDYSGTVSREEFMQVLSGIRGEPVNIKGKYNSYLDRAISEGYASADWAGTGKTIMTRGDMVSVMSGFVQEDPELAELLTMIDLIKDLNSIPTELRWDTFRVYKAGLINGRVDGTVGVSQALTREEMVLMFNNYLKYSKSGSNLMHMV